MFIRFRRYDRSSVIEKDDSAIEEGEHRFCDLVTGRCEGIAKFVMVWAKQNGTWRITSVLSYGHRAATAAGWRSTIDG